MPYDNRWANRDGIEKQYRTSRAAQRLAEAKESPELRTYLPSAPCFKCGVRGWCEHRSAEDQ